MKRSSKTQFDAIRLAIVSSILTLACAYSSYAQTSTPDKAFAKMTIIGIAGDNADGTIEVVGIDQRSSNTGGKASYSLIVTKKIDRATPNLFMMNAQGALLAQVKIVWTKLNPSNNLEEFSHSITLSHVTVSSIRQRPADNSNPEARQSDEYEDITFSVNSVVGTPMGRVVWEYSQPGKGTLVQTAFDFAKQP